MRWGNEEITMLRFNCIFSEEQLMLDQEFEKYIKQMEGLIMFLKIMAQQK